MTTIVEEDPYEARRMRRKNADRISGIIMAAAMLVALALVGGRIWAIASGPLPPGPGVEAPGVVGITNQGVAIDTSKYDGKVVLVDFWATWCPPCRAAMPTLESMHRDYRDKGLVVLGVNQEPGEEGKVTRYLRRAEITFDSVMDEGDIAPSWGVYTFPTSFIIGRDGVIRAAYRGPASQARLRRDIESALSDQG